MKFTNNDVLHLNKETYPKYICQGHSGESRALIGAYTTRSLWFRMRAGSLTEIDERIKPLYFATTLVFVRNRVATIITHVCHMTSQIDE